MDLLGGPKIKAAWTTIRTAIYGLRTTRDFPTAITSTDTDITGAAYALVSATHEIDLNGAPAAAMRLVLDDGATGNDKIAVKIYGSVDGTNFTDAWHEKITGSIDPIINDYGAINKVLDLSGGLRKVQVWGIRTYTGAARSSCQMIAQIKYEAVSVNVAELLKKVVDACFDLGRGNVGASIQNWPSNNITPISFFDNGGVFTPATAGTYLPSSTGMSLAGIDSLSITGDLTAGAADTVTVTFEVCNDEDTATTGNWKQIYFLNDMTGTTANSLTVNNADLDFAIPWRAIGTYANIRIKLVVVGGVSNTIIIKGSAKGA